MPKITAAVAALLLALTLTGCGDDTASDTEPRAFAQSTEQTPTAGAAEPETEEAELSAEDEAFLKYVSDELLPDTGIGNASDEELIAAGHQACDDVRSGIPLEDVRVIDGETPASSGYYMDSSTVMNGALYNYCPDLIPDVG